MRTPTPLAEALAWHTAAMAGHEPDTTEEPRCGWFKRKLVKHGPLVPARIWLDQEIDEAGELLADERLLCEVNGQWAGADDQWPWLCGNPISNAEFDYLTASIAWSAEHAPHEPRANPRRAVDWLAVPTPTF